MDNRVRTPANDLGWTLAERVVDWLSDKRFITGFVGGCYFTVAAAWLWSFFL